MDVTASTNNAGQYTFGDLPAGTYTLTETQPANFADGADLAGTAEGTVGSDTISAIALGAAIDAAGYAFGERGASGTIAGTVWRDVNHDRTRGSDETALSGWTVELYQAALLVRSTTTNSSGQYQFEDVRSGSGYEIRFREPSSGAVYGKPVTNEIGTSSVARAIGPVIRAERILAGARFWASPLAPGERVSNRVCRSIRWASSQTQLSPATGRGCSRRHHRADRFFDPALCSLGARRTYSRSRDRTASINTCCWRMRPRGVYSIAVTAPPGRYTPGPSSLIPCVRAR